MLLSFPNGPADRGRPPAIGGLSRPAACPNRATSCVRPIARPSGIFADNTFLARLLPVLGATYGPDGFTSRDCAEEEAPGLRFVLRGMSAKAIGKLLAKADDIPIEKRMVRRHAREFQVIVWIIVAC
jgi:hypothetical protein